MDAGSQTKKTKNLGQDSIFRLLLWGPIALALVFFCIISFNSNLIWRLDVTGFNNLLTYFKVPFYTASTSIPLAGLYAAIFRSEQTQIQIQAQTSQNHFANHFKHLEEFKKAVSSQESIAKYMWQNIEIMHYKFYPKTLSGNYDCDIDSNEIGKVLLNFAQGYYMTSHLISDYDEYIKKIKPLLKIDFFHTIKDEFFLKKETFETINTGLCFAGNSDNKRIFINSSTIDSLQKIQFIYSKTKEYSFQLSKGQIDIQYIKNQLSFTPYGDESECLSDEEINMFVQHVAAYRVKQIKTHISHNLT